MRGRTCRTCALALVGVIACAGAAQAKTFEVTRSGDPNPGNCRPNDCSLREAILAANARPGADKVVLPAKRYKLARAGSGEDAGMTGDLDVNNDPLAIVHPGKGRARIDANGLDRVLHAQGGAPVRLSRIVVTGGETNDNGGGILAHDRIALSRSVVAGNHALFDGGGIDTQDSGAIKLTRSAVRGNDADDDGGGVNGAQAAIVIRRSRITGNEAGETAGGLRTTEGPRVVIDRSAVSGNSAVNSGGGVRIESLVFVLRDSTVANNETGDNGGGLWGVALGTLRIIDSTVSGNRAGANGGGAHFDGPTVRLTNSTLSGNRANERGGGIHAQDGADVALNAVTVTRNRAGADDPGPLLLTTGGGLSRISSIGFRVRNSLIALNTIGAAGTARNDCATDTTFESLGHNLLSSQVVPGACEGFDEPTDRVRQNPKIGMLKRNGGPTKTVALKKGSPAIGKAHRPSAPNRDQRGRKRDRKPDIGAFERGA